jgi:hypothetical protein
VLGHTATLRKLFLNEIVVGADAVAAARAEDGPEQIGLASPALLFERVMAAKFGAADKKTTKKWQQKLTMSNNHTPEGRKFSSPDGLERQ